MRKWSVDVKERDGGYILRLLDDGGEVANIRLTTQDYGGTWWLPSWQMWFKPMPARIALAVKWAVAKVRSLEDDDNVKAQAEVLAAGWTKAAQAMFAEAMKGAAE